MHPRRRGGGAGAHPLGPRPKARRRPRPGPERAASSGGGGLGRSACGAMCLQGVSSEMLMEKFECVRHAEGIATAASLAVLGRNNCFIVHSAGSAAGFQCGQAALNVTVAMSMVSWKDRDAPHSQRAARLLKSLHVPFSKCNFGATLSNHCKLGLTLNPLPKYAILSRVACGSYIRLVYRHNRVQVHSARPSGMASCIREKAGRAAVGASTGHCYIFSPAADA